MKSMIGKLLFLGDFFICYVQTQSQKLRYRLFSPWFARAAIRCICHRQRSSVHSPKRKSRRIAIALFALLLTACQPTPEADVVVNKTEGKLEELLVATPEASPAPEVKLKAWVNAPESVREDLNGHVYGGELTVHIDAAVEVPEVSRVPVYTVRFRTFRTQEKEALTKKLLGDGPYFDGNRDRAIYANCDNMVRP